VIASLPRRRWRISGLEIKSVEFRRSAMAAAERPREWFPHIAVAGRSNVGKSSLLNWLFRRPLARVAKAPGKTRTLNFFLINGNFYLVDMPGYGYAKVQGRLRQQWGRELGRYVADEERLAGVVSLMDIRRDPTDLDLDLQDLVVGAARERLVVLTKADKVSRSHRARMQQRVQHQLDLARRPLAVSVRSADGRSEVLDQIQELVSGWRSKQRGD
jgi:GTP-binding protein